MRKIQLKYDKGKYFTDSEIDITVEEWKELLCNEKIFTKESKEMIINWCKEDGYKATNKVMTQKYYPQLKASPYTGIVDGLTTRILKYLNRFEVMGVNSEKSKFIVPFEGWHVDFNPRKNFIWKVRNELVKAIEELNLIDYSTQDEKEDPLVIVVGINFVEGAKKQYYTTKYERSIKNRNAAIEKHGAVCVICGFDFEKTYGEIGKGFIEVHHNKPLSSLEEPIEINPEKDMDCVCSNCHGILHRRKNEILTVAQVKKLLEKAKSDMRDND